MQGAPYLALAVATGLLVPVQLALNAQLGQALRSPFTGALFVFLVGSLAMAALVIVLRAPMPGVSDLRAVPLSAWGGGLVATLYILAVVIVVPKAGVATSAVLIIAGQIAGALILDHLGAFGAPKIEISPLRIGGLAAVIAGAVMVRMG